MVTYKTESGPFGKIVSTRDARPIRLLLLSEGRFMRYISRFTVDLVYLNGRQLRYV